MDVALVTDVVQVVYLVQELPHKQINKKPFDIVSQLSEPLFILEVFFNHCFLGWNILFILKLFFISNLIIFKPIIHDLCCMLHFFSYKISIWIL